MTAQVFSISNMKGGVGKTTIAVALAHEFAKGGAKVLLVDLDAQANASFWICGDQTLTGLIEKGKTIDAFLEDAVVLDKPAALKNYVFPEGPAKAGRVSIIPSSPELRIIEREMIVFLSRRRRNLLEVERVVSDLFDAQMKDLKATYDYIVFDSAPGISALTEAALRSSELIIVPTVPDFISNLGLEAFCKNVCWSSKETASGGQRKPWVIANLVRATPHHEAMLREMRSEADTDEGGFNMFQIEIPDTPWIEEAAADVNGDSSKRFAAHDTDMFKKLAREALAIVERERAG